MMMPVARIGALLPFVMMIVILLFRPRGLLGTQDTSAERVPRKAAIWIVALVVAMLMPCCFITTASGRHSGFVLSMLSQMGMMSILALSYNMLLGQAGLFSFCHATFFGIGGYATIDFLNMAGDGGLP